MTTKRTSWQSTVAVLMVALIAAAAVAVPQEPKEKKVMGPIVRGVVQSVDAAKKTITVSVVSDASGKKTTEKTFGLAADVQVILSDNLTKDKPAPEGKLSDVTPGTGVELQLLNDGTTATQITARGPNLLGSVKGVDADKKTLTVVSKGEKGPVERTLAIPEGVQATLSDGLTKADKTQEKKLIDLVEGTRVVVQLSVDRKRALAIRVQNDALRGTLKGIDNSASTVTVEVKEDGGLVEKLLTLGKGAKVEGNPKSGDTVIVDLSVFDQKTAIRVRVP